MPAPEHPGNIISLAGRLNPEEVRMREDFLRAILARWTAWQIEGRKFHKHDLYDDLDVNGVSVRSWDTVRAWLNTPWGTKVYKEWLGEAEERTQSRLLGMLDLALDGVEDLLRSSQGIDKARGIDRYFDLFQMFDVLQKGQAPRELGAGLTVVMGDYFKGKTVYRPAQAGDEEPPVDAEVIVVSNQSTE